MTKTTAVIIEDEIPAARMLMEMLKNLRPEWDIVTIPGYVEEAINWFEKHKHPDIIFLDIHLIDGNAFDFLSITKPQSSIIFTTAYDQYAVKAFSVNSIDYLLKPIEADRLKEAIEKFEKRQFQEVSSIDERIEILLQTLKNAEKKYRNRFMISSDNELWALDVDTISYFHSENKITFAVTPNGREHVIPLSLNKLEEELDPKIFFRVNRQIIINIDSIEKAIPYFKGKIKLIIRPKYDKEIIISEHRSQLFRLWLNY